MVKICALACLDGFQVFWNKVIHVDKGSLEEAVSMTSFEFLKRINNLCSN
jgi:hypothetical protein